MSVIPWLVLTFFAVVASGPAGLDWLERRRAARRAEEDRPLAKVVYLPSLACREHKDPPPPG